MKILARIIGFVRENPALTALVVIAIIILLSLQQCNKNRELKAEIKAKEEALKQEQARTANNLKALQDTVTYLRKDSIYTKRILAARQGEIENLDKELAQALANVKTVTNTKIKEVPKFVYITDINANVTTTDVLTRAESDSNMIGVGVEYRNPILSINTRTWFNFQTDSNKRQVNVVFADRYGPGKPSQVDYKLNVRLTIAQTEAADGSKRIYIKPTDTTGAAIDPKLLGINNVQGVDFIDVAAPTKTTTKQSRIVMSVGPQMGVTILNGKVQPYIGFGFGVGIPVRVRK